jgi:hypothetical protein
MAPAVGGQSPENIAYHLDGLQFPASKREVIEHAKRTDAEAEVLELLERLPEREYADIPDVMTGIAQED